MNFNSDLTSAPSIQPFRNAQKNHLVPGPAMIARLYRWLLRISKVAGAGTLLVGVPYGIWEYTERKYNGRVEQTLKVFEKFNSAPFTEYRMNIAKAVAKNKNELAQAAKDEKELARAIIEMVNKDGIESDLWLVMDFFDGVTVCVIQNICEASTTNELFRERARDFYVTFYQYIQSHRSEPTSQFGLGLETIATNRRLQEN